jgi:hypothetical protein
LSAIVQGYTRLMIRYTRPEKKNMTSENVGQI